MFDRVDLFSDFGWAEVFDEYRDGLALSVCGGWGWGPRVVTSRARLGPLVGVVGVGVGAGAGVAQFDGDAARQYGRHVEEGGHAA